MALRTIRLREISGTSDAVNQSQWLTASSTLPIFSISDNMVLDDLVLVCHRDERGEIIGGGLFGYSATVGEVVKINLIDDQNTIVTDRPTPHLLYCILTAVGPYRVKQHGTIRTLPMSIVDVGADVPSEHSTIARTAVRSAFLKDLDKTTGVTGD